MSGNNTVWVIIEKESQLIQTRNGKLCLWMTEDGAERGLEAWQRAYVRQEDKNRFEVREADLILRPILSEQPDRPTMEARVDESVGVA